MFFRAKKKITRLFPVLLILAIMLSFSPAPTFKANAEDFSFPRLGSDTLADSEGYEEANLIQKSGLFLTGYTPARTETLDKTYYGFSLSGDFNGIILKAKKGNDTFTQYLKTEVSDTFYGDDTSFDIDKSKTSELFIFTEGVKEIEFYYSGEKNFSINKYEFASTPEQESIKPAEFASTSAEIAYKEKLFSQMGFNLITREEWGAPTASPWAPTIANVNRIVVHHTATSVDMANPKNTVMAVYNYHYNKCADNSGSWPNCANPSLGTWTDIGYNYLIDPYGNIYEGRSGGNGVVGAHAIPNTGSIGISILGNYVSQDPTQVSMEALTRLVSAITQLNNFNAVWHGGDPASSTGLYGHRDLASTACPARIYNQLSTVASLAIQMKPVNSTLQNVDSRRNELINNRDYAIEGTKAQVMLNSANLSAITKEKLLTQSRGVEKVTEFGSKIIYVVDNSKVDQLIAETLLVAPESNAQPNFLYKLESWDNSDPERSVPSDYDPVTHWTAEKIKLPEAWKELGGCASDNSCGGDPSVVVAVLDTGLAYENFSYDAGDDDTYTVGKFNGIYMEYPSDSTQDGTFVNGNYEGYERQYTQSSEMGGVNIVSPYDAVQDMFCGLRSLDGNPANNCNVNELAKINHPNDDYGHGTLVATIIAGKTSDAAPNKVVGIAHNVSVMPVKVFYPNDRSMCQNSSGNLDLTCSDPDRDYRVVGDSLVISNAIDYAVTNGADVINMSLRGVGTDPMMEAAVNDAVAAGVVVVAAAGNDNSNIANYFPASFKNVISVGATNSNDTRASYSNYGNELDLVAPVGDSGLKIASQSYSCHPSKNDCSDETNSALFSTFTSNSTPTTVIGTSFAAPQVSAAVALIKSVRTDPLTVDQIRDILLFESTTDIGTVGIDKDTGRGLLNINKLLRSAINGFSKTEGLTCPDGCWAISNASEPVAGDFNNDGFTDFAVMYQYSNLTIRIWTFQSDGDGNFTKSIAYTCGPGCWNMVNSGNLAAGDFDNDGDDDLAIMYQYSNSSMGIWMFHSDGSGQFAASIAYLCGPGCWDLNNSGNLVSGDFNSDGHADLAIIYQYSNATIRIWTYESDGIANFNPLISYVCGPGCWDTSNSGKLTSDDYDNDSDSDLSIMYQYSNLTIRIWTFKSDGNSTFSRTLSYLCGPGCWSMSNSGNLTSGDLDNDGDPDITIPYVYSNGSMRIWAFINDSSGNLTRQRWYYCGNNCWNFATTTDMISGNFKNDTRSDLSSMVQLKNYKLTIWTFSSIIYP